ncbi:MULTISPECIES: sensor histidine kinase [Psychrobacillus]|uniref:Sensor histidine kinase n=1 Tax=Psychrobacillus faecigallinarum TaxID=2762235 RepID=A0ABR8RAD7_9BACI|nr:MULTISPECIES: sensor histidine kinase [Psychrobacillus]MBD7944684.1 sensor histidine kinase [Psychrobacillus faecigallinarum]QEY21205.1 sensor histidine kinase [Psychrobacillus sp. AK 1817]QGM31722.1 sensor histidine kinase [Bacillus sp. N3536]
MRIFLGQGISIFTYLVIIIALLLYVIWGWPNEEAWLSLLETTYAQIPFGVWIVFVLAFISFGFSLNTLQKVRSQEKKIETSLRPLLAETFEPSKKKYTQTKRMQATVTQLEQLILTQRKTLQRITNEKAETQDRIIQERLVQERQRLARELHDSVSQQLFAASMLLSTMVEIEEAKNGEVPKTLMQTEKIVQQAQLEMRALLLHLRPAALHNKTLKEGLEELLQELQEKVFFTIRYRLEEVSLSKGAEDHLFRIAQETLSNTLRHAKATEVDILFVERDNLAIFRVQDNGVGFEVGEGKNGSYGIQSVRERAVEIGATCKVVSVPSQGTIVEVKLPIEKPVAQPINLEKITTAERSE